MTERIRSLQMNEDNRRWWALVTGGRLGDLFGRRRVFLGGVIVFAASSGAIGFSPSDTWLVAWRAVQGVGSAMMMPATLSIITNAFPPAERGKAIGTWAGVSALALASSRCSRPQQWA